MALEPSPHPLFTHPRPGRPRSMRSPRAARRARGEVDTLPVWLRRLRVEVLLWAFREGRPLDAAALTAVLGAKHERDEEPFGSWTRVTVRELLWVDVARWCEAHGAEVPRSTALTMWTLLDHLEATDGLGPGSDRLALLREPLLDSGGLDRHGREATARRSRPRHPSLARQQVDRHRSG